MSTYLMKTLNYVMYLISGSPRQNTERAGGVYAIKYNPPSKIEHDEKNDQKLIKLKKINKQPTLCFHLFSCLKGRK